MDSASFPLVYWEPTPLEVQDLIGYALEPWSVVLSSSQWPMLNGVVVPIEVEAWDHSCREKLFALLRAEVVVLQVWRVPHCQPIVFLSALT
jgi:hypothetical protein